MLLARGSFFFFFEMAALMRWQVAVSSGCARISRDLFSGASENARNMYFEA
jgi:hypothetical protein